MSETLVIRFTAVGEAQMLQVGTRVAAFLHAGDLLLLRGDLGAGKTTLTRAITGALGSAAAVSSPTFALIHVYDGGRFPVVHVDAYRLRSQADLETIGLDEYLSSRDSVVIVEWPERIESALPDDRLEVAIMESGDDARRLTISASGERWALAVPTLQEALTAELSGC